MEDGGIPEIYIYTSIYYIWGGGYTCIYKEKNKKKQLLAYVGIFNPLDNLTARLVCLQNNILCNFQQIREISFIF